MKYISVVISILFACLISSCHKDEEIKNNDSRSIFTAQVLQEITGTIIGYVYDENNRPVADAVVEKYNLTTRTNKHGVFVMKNVRMDKQGTYIKITKNGYILGSDFVYPLEKGTAYAYVKLMRLENKSLDPKLGGDIAITGGGKISFPANAIVNSNNVPYEGTVSVTAKFLDPRDKEIGNLMPGGLLGDIDKKYTVVLGTLGMVAVELRDKDGNELNLKSGQKAVIQIPATTSFKPKEIDLWSFDEDLGRWISEGVAQLVGEFYVAEVGHFSFWNCDAPFPLIEVCGKVLYQDGTPAANIGIQILADGLGAGYGVTNSNGEFCGKMPKGKKLTITVSHFNCVQNASSVMVGPFENNVLLDDIVVSTISNFIVSGNINCNGAVVNDGIIVIKAKESTLIFDTKEDGSFSIDLTGLLCGSQDDVTIFGFDNSSVETSASVVLTATNTTPIDLNLCSSACDHQGAISYDCESLISVAVTNGSGNYTYLWNTDGATGPTVVNGGDSLLFGKVFCVTVTDVANGCAKVFCKKIQGKPQVYIEKNCQSGQLSAVTSTQSSSTGFTYIWSNGATTQKITATTEGSYQVTVTNENGCTGVGTNIWGGISFIDPNPTYCTGENFSFNSSPFSGANYYVPGTNIFGPLTFPIIADVFSTKFNFYINIFGEGCESVAQITLPQLIEGLTTTVTNTTCATCSDGKINYSLVNTAICVDCTVGDIKIFNINNTSIDLISQNAAGLLPKGEYYVVVADKINECYVAFNKVKIN